ncbi:RagB/SusD family nutrient uptake outer membrane protein [Mucilaginibacter jinjuensis]|uniref:RagB/SusD family nutrient uptake outer membrane protein n=1 Tax=Mucilaginibacter jinjuensis TaxID=1176721 RepID=A0ABY7T2M7_9SPHI|nr:RagB/SusD family nutrient uptake outer membrane protein [Mucilaginibacter jinjuensis]WCT10700.1 RagB/SusD family nutrient uptake outer membrane protein [Mucilaginibacter jinjuensis]
MKIKNIFSALLGINILLLVLVNSGCKKSIEVGPSKVSATSSNAFTSNSAAQTVVAGILTKMSVGDFYQGPSSVSLCMGLASDELVSLSTNASSLGSFYTNSYTALVPPPFWTTMYRELFYCNTAINGITASSAITPAVKAQLLGELKFIRAYIYFYAVNLYGTPPLTLTDDYTVNNVLANTPADQVYAQIIKDLTDAQSSLADNIYVDGTGATVTDRVRPNKQVATAMLARVYLYLQDWKNAEAQASAVIANSNYTLVTNLNQVFLKGSKETLWALQPVSTVNLNTIDAAYLIVNTSSAAVTQLPLNKALVNSFEAGDGRLANWTGTYTTTSAPITTYRYANKYKVSSNSPTVAVTEYPIMMRFAEQYLIRAEARAQQGNTGGAAADLNAIRLRAGLAATTFTTQTDLLNAIYHERQVELFTEWGHRWFDLKRTGKLDAVMTTVAPTKAATWSSYKQLMPIPSGDILADPNLKQNTGYN